MPRTRLSQRPERFTLNAGSSLANGLVFAGLGQSPGTRLYRDDSEYRRNGILSIDFDVADAPAIAWRWHPEIRRVALTSIDAFVLGQAVPIASASNACTTSLWIRPDATLSNMYCLDQGTNTRTILGGYQAGCFNIYNGGYPTGTAADTQIAYRGVGTWDHLAYGSDGAKVYGYLNGQLKVSPNANLNATPGTLYLASSGSATNRASISFADVLIHSRLLSPSEIAALADPSNYDLSVGGVPLLRSVRRFWPVCVPSGSTASGVGSSAGVGAASGVGSSLAASAGASAGVGAAAGVGSSLYAGAGSASGVATVAATGSSLFKGVGASAGVGAAAGVGSALSAGVGSSAGVAVVSAAGASLFSGVGTAAGVGAASGVGSSVATGSGVGEAAGSATVAGVGSALFAGVGTSAGIGSVAGVGSSLFSAVGSAAGVAVATGVGASEAGGTGVGLAAGSCVVVGVGAALAAGVGTAAGVALVLGRSTMPVGLTVFTSTGVAGFTSTGYGGFASTGTGA
jgi:hypothetical protein